MPEPERIDDAEIRWDTILTSIMTLWHENPRYRDALHRPLQLKLRARGGPCLAQLIRIALRRGDARTDVRLIARSLVRTGAVVQRGPWYTPAGRFVSFRHAPPAALSHTLMCAGGLFRTIERNLHTRDPRDALLERVAFNSHIPIAALPTVHRYLKREGDNLLARLDAYLKRWEIRAGSEPSILVGFAAFAFEDPGDI